MGALIPLAISLAPEVAKWLFGAGAERVTEKVGAAVQAVTGAADPDAAMAALSGKPELAVQLRTELAKIAAEADKDQRAAEQAELAARLGDIADARKQTLSLAQAGSRIAWGAPVVSAIVLVAFFAVVMALIWVPMPPGSENILTILLGSLSTMASAVVGYWVGSSAGSADKAKDLSAALVSAHVALATATQTSPKSRTTDELNDEEYARIRRAAG
jgi:hypothetical protein